MKPYPFLTLNHPFVLLVFPLVMTVLLVRDRLHHCYPCSSPAVPGARLGAEGERGSIRWRARHVAAGSDSLVMTAAIMTEAMVTGAAAAAAALFRMRRQLGCHCGSSGLPAAHSQRGWVFGRVCKSWIFPSFAGNARALGVVCHWEDFVDI